MMHKKEELIKLTPELVKLIVKTIKYSKGGLDKAERRELGEDLTGTCLSASWRLQRIYVLQVSTEISHI
jgi:hypothetical protein